ncbi:hypothetical protein EXN66_Car000102 [Channa argus]|uniref:Ig-like domain-containing protein n=1 Tax=Channa argus TaxID=215402 RepID=A0A6G1QW58_CHAAH|nr:hypothetical protein EXN66_Car000102 [Channa argus]
MKVTVYSCWFFLVLGSNAAAEIIQKVFEEKQQISLPCPRPQDAKVTWSRETNGHKEDILTAHDRDEKHINDPDKRFSSLGDKSLYISRAAVSDSGTYFCNNKKAVELTVIPSGTSDQTEPTYSTICEYPPTEIKMATESPYSLISGTVVDGNNKGQTELNYSTYVLLDKPQTPANNHDHL